MVCMVLKVGKLVASWVDSWLCGGGGGGLLDSIFGWVAWEFVVGYVLCKGVGG
jgi:hypothetical protein